jgi:hypothetical protein
MVQEDGQAQGWVQLEFVARTLSSNQTCDRSTTVNLRIYHSNRQRRPDVQFLLSQPARLAELSTSKIFSQRNVQPAKEEAGAASLAEDSQTITLNYSDFESLTHLPLI